MTGHLYACVAHNVWMFTKEENDMEEKNEQGPSTVEIAKPAPVPTLQELQNYILFLKSRINQLEEEEAYMEARIYALEIRRVKEERPEEGGVK